MKSIENLNTNEGGEVLGKLDISDLKKSLEEYNKQFDFGTLLAERLIEGFEGKNEDNNLYKPKISIEDIEDKHRGIIDKTGISLESVRKGVMFASETSDEERQPSEMRINLKDGKKFLSYLNSLNIENLKESQITGLKLVADSLTKQLVEQYELDNPEDERMLELFGSLNDIIQEYKRLDSSRRNGLTESMKDLSEYISLSRDGYLREYFVAKNNHLLDTLDSDSFGPWKWHKDSNEKSYERFWNESIKKLNLIGKNQKADNLYKKVKDNLKEVLFNVKKDITDNSEHFKKNPQKTKNYLAIIDKYSGILEDM
jgi:hypothetical protein